MTKSEKGENKMTHFTVLAIGEASGREAIMNHLYELFEPYWEGLEVEAYPAEVSARSLAEAEKELEKYNEDELIKYLSDYHGRTVFKDENDKKFYYMTKYNPDSKWDWWVLGGRWSGSLDDYLKDKCDSDRIMSGESGVFDNRVGTDAAFISELSLEKMLDEDNQMITVAILTKDGWFAQGEVGWFGYVEENDEWDEQYREILKKIFADAGPNTFMAVVDAHI
jgi:hypothetical protein